MEELIKEHFGGKRSPELPEGQVMTLPEFPLVPHSQPRYYVMAEKEAGGVCVNLYLDTLS